MQKIIKLNSLVYKSTNFIYGYLSSDKKVLITIRSDLSKKRNYSIKRKNFEKLLHLFNDQKISYTTLIFLLNRTSKIINSNSDYSLFKVLTELSWESGIFLNKKKDITFIKI
jgi:hypothetical protein